eukprot:305355_1
MEETTATKIENNPAAMDLSEKNAQEIELLKQLVSSITKSKIESATSNYEVVNSEISSYIENASSHDKRGTFCKVMRVITLLAIVGIYFLYEYRLYKDPEYNKLSQSAIERIDYMEMPYFYIYGGNNKDLSLIDIIIEVGSSNLTYFKLDYVTYNNDVPFVYTSEIVNWTVVDMLGDIGGEIFIVPPYGMTLAVGSSISLLIQSYKYITYGIDDDTDLDYTDEILQKYSQGESYGLFWDIESISEIENANLTKLKYKYFDSWERLRYTFVTTVNYYLIDLFEENDLIANRNKIYYTTSFIASIMAERYTYFYYWNVTNDKYWRHWTEINLYPNPSGGGLKTTLTISQYKSLTDVLATVGGIFAPVNAILFLLMTWCMYGIHISRFHIHGFARLSPLTYANREQIKLYLIQLGILTKVDKQAEIQLTEMY